MKAINRYASLIAVLFICTAPCPLLAEAANANNPVGYWVSVDFVRYVKDFHPGKRTLRGELVFKEVEFMPDGKTSGFFTWHNDWILHQDGKTKAQFYIKTIDDTDYLFLPWLSGDVTERGMEPWFYVLKKAPPGTAPPKQSQPRGGFRQITAVDSVSEYDDVRWKDLTKIDIGQLARLIATFDFNNDTVWPDPNKLPPAKRPDTILKKAMNPGLGIRRLHAQGITGKGVSVAIIDQPLYPDHPEYKGKIVKYFDTGCESESSMHGPGVTSLLAGTQCGTAPEAKVYYAAAPSWKKDAAYYAKALDWILEQNKTLPDSEKIRVVSVSAAPSGQGSPFETNTQMWDDAFARAEAAGVLVLDCSSEHGIIGPCWLDSAFSESVSKCTPGLPGRSWQGGPSNDILAPTCPRTTAEQYEKDEFGWQYNGRGGLSWAIPYVAGVLALGWQVNPDLTAEQMKELLYETAYTHESGQKIINPNKFVLYIKRMKKP